MYDLDARECVASYGRAASATYRVAAHAPSGLVAVAGYEGDLTLYDHGARRAVARAQVSTRAPHALRVLDEDTLAWIDHDEALIVSRVDGALCVRLREPVKALDVSRVDGELVIAHREGVVALSPGGGRRAWPFANGPVRLARVTPEGVAAAVTVDADGVLQRWRFDGAASVEGTACSRLERLFWSEACACVVAWGERAVARWRRGESAVERLEVAPARDAVMSADGRRLLLLRSEPARASCVDLDTLSERELPASGYAAAVSPDGAQALLCDWNAFARVDLDAATRAAFTPPFPRFRAYFGALGDAVHLCDDGGVIARCALDGAVTARVDLACRWGYGDQLTGDDTGVRELLPAPDGALVAKVGSPVTEPGSYDNWDGIYLRTDHALRLLDAATLSTRATLCAVSASATLLAGPCLDGYALLDAGRVSWVRGTDFGAPRVDLARGVSVTRAASSPDGAWLAFVNADGVHRARAFEPLVASWRPAVPVRDVAVSARGEVFALDAWGGLVELGGAT